MKRVRVATENINEGRDLMYAEGKKKGIAGVPVGHWIHLFPMYDGERADEGVRLFIGYMFYDTVFGRVLIASTAIGLCHLGFVDGTDMPGWLLSGDGKTMFRSGRRER
jgi:AraC family transcriptional regulator of adaptative response/methylated-DNA-[protein]-cysteine methyltransferase